MRKVLLHSTEKAPRRTRNRLRRAWKAVVARQELDEQRYTEAVLGLNHLGVLFRSSDDDWGVDVGRKCKDLLYGFWWEEDLRLRLAAELLKLKDCQVHGQVHIRTKVREKARLRIRQTRKSRYPDLLLIATKRKEHTGRSTERNLETAAIELKYFGMGRRPSDIRRAVQKDLKKLLGYSRPRSSPRADAGYFFCIDETGHAADVLDRLFRLKQFRKRPLGYGVVVPRFVREKIPYPAGYDHQTPVQRRVAYLLDLVIGKLKGIAFTEGEYIREEDYPGSYYGFWCRLRGKARGRMYVCWPGHVEGVNRRYMPVVLSLKGAYVGALRKFRTRYAWSTEKQRFVPSDRALSTVLLTGIRRSKLRNMRGIRQEARRVASQLRQVVGRVR